jgi:PAS domain S-box-containing protein
VDGIVVVDNKGNPLIFNEGAERILGYKAKEVIGHPEVFALFLPPSPGSRNDAPYAQRPLRSAG